MKPIINPSTVIDTIEGEEVEFTISDTNKALVVRSMADLYSNREGAVIREYSTNARDAMVEAGKADEPIIVLLPKPFDKDIKFVVIDKGVGMSLKELKETYTVFGDSSKRDSNDLNGMLGYGSKSAVAYTNTFTITSVKDGLKNVAMVTRFEDDLGGYHIKLKVVLRNLHTIEGNGTTVEVPVHNIDEFNKKAQDFYRFWKPGTVLVDGIEPQWAVGDKLDEGLYYSTTGASYVVLGNVPYPIANPGALFRAGMKQVSFVGYLEECNCNGLEPHAPVEFTPNREALKYSEHTKVHLQKIIDDYCEAIFKQAATEISAETTRWEAWKVWSKWSAIVGSGNLAKLTFDGEFFANTFQVNGIRYSSHRSRFTTSRITEWRVDQTPSTLFITDFISTMSTQAKAKAKEYANLQGLQVSLYVYTQDAEVSPWVDQKHVVRWEDLKAALPVIPKAPRAVSTAPGRLAGTFDLVTSIGHEVEQDVPDTKDLYFIGVQEYNKNTGLASILKQFSLDWKVVKVPANRKNKFLNKYPHAKPVMPMLKTKVKTKGKDLLSADAKVYFSYHPNDVEMLRRLSKHKIDDPALKEASRVCAVEEAKYLKEYNRQKNLCRLVGESFEAESDIHYRYNNNVTRPLKKYPLVDISHVDHSVHYINSIYQARKGGKVV